MVSKRGNSNLSKCDIGQCFCIVFIPCLWCTFVYFGVLWYTLAYFGVLWCTLLSCTSKTKRRRHLQPIGTAIKAVVFLSCSLDLTANAKIRTK